MMRIAWKLSVKAQFLNETGDTMVRCQMVRQIFMVPALEGGHEPVPTPDEEMLLVAPDGSHWSDFFGGMDFVLTPDEAEGLEVGRVYFTGFIVTPEGIPTTCPE